MRLFMTREEHEAMAKPVVTHQPRAGGRSLATVALGAVAGALVVYLFDPRQGRGRRTILGGRIAAAGRRGSRSLGRVTRHAGSTLASTRARLSSTSGDDEGSVDDATITDRVESQVFRDQDLPKGELNIDTVDGVVMIRGQVERPDVMNEIVARTRRVDGVRDVRNLMRPPGKPVPHME